MTLWDKITGLKSHPAFCPRCGVDVAPWKHRSVIFKFKCVACQLKAVVRLDQVPDVCPSCQRVASGCWVNEGPIAPGEKIPGEYCSPCRRLVDAMVAEINKGGVPWKCSDCRAEGVEKAGTEFAKAVRRDHPKGAVIQFSRNNGCPVCGPLNTMQN